MMRKNSWRGLLSTLAIMFITTQSYAAVVMYDLKLRESSGNSYEGQLVSMRTGALLAGWGVYFAVGGSATGGAGALFLLTALDEDSSDIASLELAFINAVPELNDYPEFTYQLSATMSQKLTNIGDEVTTFDGNKLKATTLTLEDIDLAIELSGEELDGSVVESLINLAQ